MLPRVGPSQRTRALRRRSLAMPVSLLAFALLAVAAAAPTAAAAYLVTGAEAPDVVMPGRDFAITATLRNTGQEDMSSALSAALYEFEEGKVCGSQQDPRFKGFINRANVIVPVPAGTTRLHPAEGAQDKWRMVIDPSKVTSPGPYQICVFAMKTQTPVEYHDYEAVNVTVRVTNTAPSASFTITPDVGNVTTEFRFRAEAADVDGDPITYSWDFGYSGAKGRARAEGATASQRFFSFDESPRTYTVTLTAFDGFDATTRSREITVFPAAVEADPVLPDADGAPDGGGSGIPAPGFGWVVAAVGLGAFVRARRRGRAGRSMTRRQGSNGAAGKGSPCRLPGIDRTAACARQVSDS